MKLSKRLAIGLGLLVIFTPLGIIIPRAVRSGDAWGEWGVDEVSKLAGYCPQGLKKLAGIWHAPLPDYTLMNREGAGAYFVSGLIGSIAVILAVLLIAGKLSGKNE